MDWFYIFFIALCAVAVLAITVFIFILLFRNESKSSDKNINIDSNYRYLSDHSAEDGDDEEKCTFCGGTGHNIGGCGAFIACIS